MQSSSEEKPQSNHASSYKPFLFLATTLSTYALLRTIGYKMAILFYNQCGGGGFNIYKQTNNAKFKRVFAIDYHPFWDKKNKQLEWKWHYHRGNSKSKIKQHRPYEGGW